MLELVLMTLSIVSGGIAITVFVLEYLRKVDTQQSLHMRKERLGLAQKASKEKSWLEKFILRTPVGVLIRRGEERKMQVAFERDLPACLEVVALGMQAGMGFDQAFSLYTERFDTHLARCCSEELVLWQKGLKSREAGLRDLARKISTSSFKHFSTSVTRALRFGAPMAPLLLNLAAEARKEYKAVRQEMVAKAPVKMLLPTGALILPAMLILVMGPIVLDLLRKMG